MSHVALLLAFAFLGLTGLGFSAFLVVSGQSKQERLRQRLQTATAPHLRMRRVEPARMLRARTETRGNTPFERIAHLFGFLPERLDLYPVKWWVVVLATLVVGRIVAGVVSGLVGLVGWVALPAIWILGSRFAFNTMLNRRRTQLYSQFPDCLSMIVRSVRAGVPLTEAIRVVAKEAPAPSDAEFSRVAGDLSIGVPIAESLKSMADRNDITEFRFFATALALQSQTGGRLGETLENLGSLIRKRMAVKARGKALSSEARTTALILGCLPMVAGGMLFIVNRAYVNVLFFDPSGQMVLAAAGIMLGIGAFTMKAIIDKALA